MYQSSRTQKLMHAMYLLAVAALVLLPIRPAYAQVETTTIDVSIELTAACSLSAEPLDFGSHSTAAAVSTNIEAQTTITVDCADQLPYEIGISLGNQPSNGIRTLRDQSGAIAVSYRLHQDSQRSIAWGDGDNGAPRMSAVGTGTPTTHTVYGEALFGQRIPPEELGDTVTVSIFL